MSQANSPYGVAAPGDSGVPRSLARVLADVAAERAAQDELWGIQDFPDGTGHEHAAAAEAAKRDCGAAWAGARLTWRHLLIEEFFEALAETDPTALRTELVQMAAAAVKWVQALDRRDGHLTHRTKRGPGRREKLVRDRVPDLIGSASRRPDVRVAGDGEYTMLLRAKLYEEVGEFIASGEVAELVDVLEVVYALASAQGLGQGELERLRAAKATRLGGFEQHYVLRPPETPAQAPSLPLVQRSVRAILLDGDDLILFKRTVPGQQPYWTTPGGRVEPEDTGLEAALRRELLEELGATVTGLRQVFTFAEETPGIDYVHTFYVCRLESMDLTKRSGPEFTDPAKGRYDIERIPLTRATVDAIPLKPAALANYLAAHATDIATLLPPIPPA